MKIFSFSTQVNAYLKHCSSIIECAQKLNLEVPFMSEMEATFLDANINVIDNLLIQLVHLVCENSISNFLFNDEPISV
jgi:hypothetical protein